MKLGSIIFDFDGTLAELNLDFGLMKERIVALGASLGLPPPEMDGTPSLELLAGMASSLPSGEREGFLTQGLGLIRDMEMEAAENSSLFPFTRPLLGELARVRVAAAIITRNLGEAVRTVFPDIEEHVAAFLPRDAVKKVKPDPAHLFEALERMNRQPEETLYVGDHPIDIKTGKRAGVKTCAVLTGRIGREEFETHGPDHIIGDCRGVLQILGCG